LAEQFGKPVPDAAALESFTIADNAEFRADLPTGWVRRLSHTRVTTTGKTRQEDTLTITRVD
jgi:hypothetical protein